MRHRAGVLAAAASAALVGVAACTSSGAPEPTATPRSPSVTASTGTSTNPVPDDPFTAAAGALLVVGPSADHADVYRLTGSGVSRVTSGAAVTGVAADRGGVVVSVRPGDSEETVRALSGGSTADLGIAAGFDPDLSGSGLVYATLETGSSVPGVTKPKAFAVEVRTSLRGTSRTVFTNPASLGSPHWISPHELVVAVGSGDGARVLRVDTTTGSSSPVGTVAHAADLQLTADASAVAVTTDSGGVVVRFSDRQQHPLPAGWSPLCWTAPNRLLAAHDGRLGLITVDTTGTPGAAAVLGPLPTGTNVYGASCGRVG